MLHSATSTTPRDLSMPTYTTLRRVVSRAARTAFAMGVAICSLQAAAGDRTAHADWAEVVARHVVPEMNTYGSSPTVLRWQGIDGAAEFENRTVCSSFVTHSLRRAYSWPDTLIKTWAGTTTPNADRYQELIVAGNGFTRIKEPEAISRGDLIAIKYLECAGSKSTGHVVIALGSAIQRPTNTEPVVPNTIQYALEIADSSQSDHFAKNFPDSRTDALGNRLTTGAGVGWMRLYRNVSTGEIQGYTWSMQRSSTYYDAGGCRVLAAGRLM